jgi:hypothetical protein
VTADQKRWKTLLGGMALIIAFSASFHVFLVKRKAIRTHRYTPQYGATPSLPEIVALEGDGVIEGEVVAVSYDKFFLRTQDRVQAFAVGSLKMPRVGDRITIAYQGGDPPTAEKLLPPEDAGSDLTSPGPGQATP